MTARDMLGNLQDYDVAELLLLLAESGRSGVFEVTHRLGLFRLAFRDGVVQNAEFGIVRGEGALALLLREPRGSFTFVPRPVPGEASTPMLAMLLGATRLLPPPPLIFDGPAKVRDDAALKDLGLLDDEARVVREVAAGRTLGSFEEGSVERGVVARLVRLGVLAPRKVRVARLTLEVWRGGESTVALDTSIVSLWTQQLGAPPKEVLLRTDEGKVVRVPLVAVPNLGVRLLVAPDVLMRFGLQGGTSVLARPPERDDAQKHDAR
ncbi:DUF4388 domain-containing protein [Deinococcus yavapaiensis]|uniref:Uncharacterized protein DUF4388 n=1 Tax=Deinococcus yavapaiensis KR-236 TaxID=694435 RepID=A0A318S614_9DEIO|nr:DUF4388 domain-containing protein [Deinococcus yavapaiensis]PYE49453.1 uncharacterized protein DUF4388 [Deinococcus yavapaiensis KR-236]